MKLLKIPFLLTIVVFPGLLFSEVDSLTTYSGGKSNKWLTFQLAYRLPINKNIIISSGHGITVEGGFNLAKFFSQKHTLSLFAGWSWKDLLWNTSFNSEFAGTYQSSLHSENILSSSDSGIIRTSAKLISSKKGISATLPGCSMNSFHNYSLYYGILIKACNVHLPALKLYAGTLRTSFMSSGNEVFTSEKEYNIFELRRAFYGAELMMIRKINQSHNSRATFSIFCEYSNFYKASLYFSDGDLHRDISLRSYLPASVMNRFKNEYSFGFKLGILFL